MEISDFEIMLKTCNKIEIPPNPNKKATIHTLITKFLLAIDVTKARPFVNSMSPVTKGIIKRDGMWIILKKGTNR